MLIINFYILFNCSYCLELFFMITHLNSKCNCGALDFIGSSLMATCPLLYKFFPSLSSPKFPQPIFLPTLKLGPTIRTEEEAGGPGLLDMLDLVLLLV